MPHLPSTTVRPKHSADRRGHSRLANLHSSSSFRLNSDLEDDPEDHAPSVGQRMFSDTASSSQISMNGSMTSSFNRSLASGGYAMSFLSRTDSTMSGIAGPGRTVGELLYSAGRRLEPVLDRMALTVIGTLSGSYVLRTPNRARLVIDRVHVDMLRKSWTRFANPKTGRVQRSNMARLLSVSPSSSVKPESPCSYRLLQNLRGDLEVRINPVVYCIFNVSLHLSFSSKRDLELDDNPEFPSQAEVRERRNVYIRLYHEALAFCPERGYSFAQMLLLLSHYKPIVASQTLSYAHSLSPSI
jgi:hypothetical protein